MSDKKTFVSYLALALAVLALVVGLVGYLPKDNLGGVVHRVQEIFPEGIKAGTSETAVINSSGQWVGATAGTTGTFSSTLGVTGTTTLDGALVANGAFTLGNAAGDTGTINGNTTFANIATLSGTTNLAGTIAATGNLTASGTNVLSGTTTISGNSVISGTNATISSATVISGAATFSSTISATGESNFNNVILGGSITAITATASVLTAAQVCDSSVITHIWTAAGDATTTMTTPAATDLTGDCLTTNGDSRLLFVKNLSTEDASTSTFTAGSGITLYSSTVSGNVVRGTQGIFVRFVRISSSAVDAFIELLTAL